MRVEKSDNKILLWMDASEYEAIINAINPRQIIVSEEMAKAGFDGLILGQNLFGDQAFIAVLESAIKPNNEEKKNDNE